MQLPYRTCIEIYTQQFIHSTVCRHTGWPLGISKAKLIIHQVKTKQIRLDTRSCINFDDSLFRYSLVFVSIEKIYQTLEAAFHRQIKHLEFRKELLRCVSHFQLSSRCLDIPMKHCFSCLIYYFSPNHYRPTETPLEPYPSHTVGL